MHTCFLHYAHIIEIMFFYNVMYLFCIFIFDILIQYIDQSLSNHDNNLPLHLHPVLGLLVSLLKPFLLLCLLLGCSFLMC